VAYNTPSGQIPGRIGICVARKATPDAGEFGLTQTIAFLDKATARAGFAGVPWVHEYHRHTYAFGFVRQKFSQLPKAPTVLPVALPLTNRDPAAEVRQVFEHKRTGVVSFFALPAPPQGWWRWLEKVSGSLVGTRIS